jgi:hypothetical protein
MPVSHCFSHRAARPGTGNRGALTRSRQLSEGLVRLTFAGWNEVDIVPRQVDGLRQLA